MSLQNAVRGRINKRQGAAAESHARDYLRFLGLEFITSIDVGWRIKRAPTGKIIGASPIASVAGDIRALIPGGRSVLCEVKRRTEKTLCWSSLEDHQVRALDDHAACGGLSLLIWHHPTGLYVLPWRPLGFTGPRCSLSVEAAEIQAIRTPRFWLPALPEGMR